MPPTGNMGVGNSHYHLALALRELGLEVLALTFADKVSRNEEGIHRHGIPRALELAVKAGIRLPLAAWGLATRGWAGKALELDAALLGSLGALRLVAEFEAFQPQAIVVPDRGACAAFWPEVWKRRCVVVSHSNPLRFLGQPALGLRDPRDAKLAVYLESLMTRHAAAAVAPSAYMRAEFLKSYPFSGRLETIPNLCDSAMLHSQAAETLPGPKGMRWIYVPAAGNQNKGSALMPDLVGRLSEGCQGNLGFFLSGSLDPGLLERIRLRAPGARIHAPGSLPYARNIAAMKSCCLCLSPTLIENFGMALLEAQSCGLAAVTFDVGGNPELVRDGETGRVVPLGDLEALVEAARRLLESPARLRRWGRQARRRSARLFSPSKAGRSYAALLGWVARKSLPRLGT
jgi:glycosyltransferase involved in cell wall biosynthesis